MTMMTKQTIIPHGVVFLYDPSMIIDVPEDTGGASILHTDNCLSIWTVQEDDGPVLLTLSDEIENIHGHRAFDGFLRTDGKRLAFNDSGVNVLLELSTPGIRTKISVFTNDVRYPTSVTCLVRSS